MTKEICEDCGKLFMAGKDAYLCPKCRKNRLSEYAKHRKLSELGTAARWGNVAVAACGRMDGRACENKRAQRERSVQGN